MQKNTISTLLQIFCVGLLASTFGFSQTNDSETVYLRVNVTDKRGRTVTDLKKESFKVREGKIEQEISYFSDREEPAGVAVLIDISDSVKLEISQAMAKVALKFVQLANNKNDYSLIAFGNEVYPLTDWGSTDEQIVKALNKVANLNLKYENTNVYDACSFALDKLEKSKFQKKILLIFSDGMDNGSGKGFGKVREKIKASDVLIYSIGFFEPGFNDSLTIQG
ncbi:MAG: VWA domain-containing protein, partial [Pyrinomonadaceae bacterium]